MNAHAILALFSPVREAIQGQPSSPSTVFFNNLFFPHSSKKQFKTRKSRETYVLSLSTFINISEISFPEFA